MMYFCWSSLRINASSLSESSKEVDLTFLQSRTDSFGATEMIPGSFDKLIFIFRHRFPSIQQLCRIKQGSYRGRSHSKGAISSHGFWKMLITISKAVIQNSR
ncbi:hypothetical protein MUK42_18087 [Musa troglodytarum]|uniref:Uncharacterized protein n=1 Tax=Musa troglodytarum TaxID=320322 RepID=A0A9E7HCK4_9LILI|nr:hypothetical protein MUK42_18087 [Musa troglodytarum]